jgi:two-component system NtrC family sensor kinase
MKKLFALLLFACTSSIAFAQNNYADSLRKQLASAEEDSTRFAIMNRLFWSYLYSNPDSSASYVQQEILLTRRMKSNVTLYGVLMQYSALASINGNYHESLEFALEGLKAAERTNNRTIISDAYNNLGDIYRDEGDYEHAIYYIQLAETFFSSNRFNDNNKGIDTVFRYGYIMHGLALTYEKFDHLDSAPKYISIVSQLRVKAFGKMDWAPVPYLWGNIYYKMGNYTKALENYHMGLALASNMKVKKDIMDNCIGLAKTFKKIDQLDSIIFYANEVLDASKTVHYPLIKLEALKLLSDVYKSKHNIDSTAKYLELILSTTDNLFDHQKLIEMQSMTFKEQLRQQEIQEAQEEYQNRIRTYMLIGGLTALLLITAILYRSTIQKQKAKIRIEQAYDELKSTQAQLVQLEKMASLGELTAGIAHEIQNPLNFVNNFSEVNIELISEMTQEIDKRNIEEVKAIADDIEENEQKIVHHGKRANAIVKSMLQHSLVSTGQKKSTDINALADQYLRLSYRSMRAKDKTFNATLKKDFDKSIEKVDIVPQDIGRVLLNLFNNAFYACVQRSRSTIMQTSVLSGNAAPSAEQHYEPVVSVSTKQIDDNILISIKDNGVGISEKVADKIFQPFFTTKPTGEGTGLGLSLSYDIIKAHGGEIKVETGVESEGAEFVIRLPKK